MAATVGRIEFGSCGDKTGSRNLISRQVISDAVLIMGQHIAIESLGGIPTQMDLVL